jgi:hypothetical protein
LVQDDGTGRELYDLEADKFETKNLADEEPEMAARLSAAVLAWRGSLPELSEREGQESQ